MRLFHNHVYRLLAIELFAVFIASFIFWPVWPAAKLSILVVLLFFLPAISIVQHFPLHWLEQFALANALGMTFPYIYSILNILGVRLNPLLYVIVPLITLCAGVWWHDRTAQR